MQRIFIYILVFGFFVIGVVYWYQWMLHGSRPEGKIGTANPASVHCTDIGGRLEIMDVSASGGQIGICHLRDGRACEEWAFFRDGTCVAP